MLRIVALLEVKGRRTGTTEVARMSRIDLERRRLVLAGAAGLGALALGTGPMRSQAQAETSRAPIPRSVLFGDPEHSFVRISPDGRRVAFLAAVEGVLNVWVAPIDEPG